ncbi:MAG: hypothetical protein PHG66_04530 [Candidatus Colwellbacteria bacterium]|nr:hypothetical protein [Candidatus Colwellbacteria bacterium]
MSTIVISICVGLLLLYGAIAIIVTKYPTSSFGKAMSKIVPSFITNLGKPSTSASGAASSGVSPSGAASSGVSPSGAASSGGTTTYAASTVNFAQCPIWKSAFATNSYNLQGINLASLDPSSPNVKAVGNFCGLGNTITQHCINTEDTIGIPDPNFPNPSTGVYGLLCKSLSCTLNNSKFMNMEWNLAAGGDGNISTVFAKDGTLKFNIYSAEDNGNFINAFCDTGRQMLADTSCPSSMTDYVTKSAAFNFFCCNQSPCTTVSGCSAVCTPAASQCLIDKGHFVSSSWNIQNFNPGSLDNDQNLAMIQDYCTFADQVIAEDCAMDQYHPHYASTQSTGWCDTHPSAPSCLYNQWCSGKSNQCLAAIGKFNTGQWNYQNMAYDMAIFPTANYNPMSSFADCPNPANFDTTEAYLAACKLSANGTALLNYCNNAEYIATNGCDTNTRINMSDSNAMNYPPTAKSITYLTVCCPLGLGDPATCNVDPTKMAAAYKSVRDGITSDTTGKTHSRSTVGADFFSYFGNDNAPQKA